MKVGLFVFLFISLATGAISGLLLTPKFNDKIVGGKEKWENKNHKQISDIFEGNFTDLELIKLIKTLQQLLGQTYSHEKDGVNFTATKKPVGGCNPNGCS